MEELTFEEIINKIDFNIPEPIRINKQYLFLVEVIADKTHSLLIGKNCPKFKSKEKLYNDFTTLLEKRLKNLEVTKPENHENYYNSIVEHYLNILIQHHELL